MKIIEVMKNVAKWCLYALSLSKKVWWLDLIFFVLWFNLFYQPIVLLFNASKMPVVFYILITTIIAAPPYYFLRHFADSKITYFFNSSDYARFFRGANINEKDFFKDKTPFVVFYDYTKGTIKEISRVIWKPQLLSMAKFVAIPKIFSRKGIRCMLLRPAEEFKSSSLQNYESYLSDTTILLRLTPKGYPVPVSFISENNLFTQLPGLSSYLRNYIIGYFISAFRAKYCSHGETISDDLFATYCWVLYDELRANPDHAVIKDLKWLPNVVGVSFLFPTEGWARYTGEDPEDLFIKLL
jgi:hypothetical protein